MDACQLEQLFAQGQVNTLPNCATRGQVLLRTDAKLPGVGEDVQSGVEGEIL